MLKERRKTPQARTRTDMARPLAWAEHPNNNAWPCMHSGRKPEREERRREGGQEEQRGEEQARGQTPRAKGRGREGEGADAGGEKEKGEGTGRCRIAVAYGWEARPTLSAMRRRIVPHGSTPMCDATRLSV